MVNTKPISALRAGFGVLRRAWWQVAAILAATSGALLLGLVFAMTALSLLAGAQRGIVVADGQATTRGVLLLGVEVGLPYLVFASLVIASATGALARVSDGVLAGRSVPVSTAIAAGIRRAPALAGGCLLGGIGAIGLLLAAPLFVAVGVVGLIGWPVAALARRRWPALRWPSARRSARWAVPLFVPLATIGRWGLLVPTATLERNGGRAALGRSRTVVPSGWSAVSASLVVIVGFYLLWNAGFDLVQRTSAPAFLVLAALLVTQVVLTTVPVASLVAVYRGVVPSTPDDLRFDDPPARDQPILQPLAIGVVMALVASLGVVVFTGHPASAAGPVVHTVTDLGDDGDATPGDGTCEATVGGGDCTLRAAVDEANASLVATTIDFATSGTIRVGGPLAVQAPVAIDGAGQQVWISGRFGGDSPPEYQLFRFTSAVYPFSVANLTLADGVGGPSGGGAIEAVAPAAGSVVANVTFTGNRSAAPGGAVAVLGGELTIANATFQSNTSDQSGADVYDLGATTIVHSTAEGSYGATSSIQSAGATRVSSSIVSYPSGLACAGVTLGTANLDDDGTCPGSSTLGALGYFDDHGGSVWTFEIAHASFAVDRGHPADCELVGFVDARGTARPHGDACDIGAYEYTGPASTTGVDVVTNPSPSDVGEPVVITATVGSTTETLPGEGSVTFTSGGVALATVPLIDGVAEHTAAGLTSGTHTFEVFFPGDGTLPPAVGSVDHEVSTPAATVVVETAPTPSDVGDDVTVTATVTGSGAVDAPTGDITFRRGGAAIATVALVDGVASTTVSGLTVGDHRFDADYAGDATYPAATGGVDHHVDVPGTTVVVSADPTPSHLGDPVTLVANISAPGVAIHPTGEVTFRSGATELGTATLVDGTASLVTEDLEAGSLTIHADYPGDGTFPAASGSVDHDVQAPSTVEVDGPATSAFGEAISVTATVAVAAGLLPTGEVALFAGATELERRTVGPDGSVAFTVSTLEVGPHVLRADYAGDALVLPSSSADLDHRVDRARTTLDLAGSPTESVVGEQVTFTATVTVDAPGSGIPTGDVTFSAPSGELGVVAVDGAGLATITTSALPLGSAIVTASYAGDASFTPAEDLVAHEVLQGRSETSLASSAAPSRVGEEITLTAIVSAVAPASTTPTGDVEFVDGDDVVATISVDASGVAEWTTSNLALGSHPIVARYLGDADLTASESPALDQDVDRWITSVDVTSSVPNSVTGQEVTFTATVVDQDGSGFEPAGTVSFSGFGLVDPVEATVDEDTGTATFTAPSPLGRGGSVSLTATYLGSPELAPSSAAIGVVVDPASVTVELTTEPANPYYGQSVTVTATVTPVAPGSGVPRGDFEIFDRGTRIRGPLDRTGSLVTSFTTPGDLGAFAHELSAGFSGTGWVAATSPVVDLDVLSPPTELELSVDPSPSIVGRDVWLTATMTVPDGAWPPLDELVGFDDGADVIGSAPLRLVGDRVEATLRVPLSSVGVHALRARFRGPNHGESTSSVVDHVVQPLPTSVGIGSNSPTLPGDPVEVTVLVANLAGAEPPTGTVELQRDGFTIDGPTTLTPGAGGFASATFTPVAPFPVGSHDLVAEYTPTGDFAAGTASHRHVVAANLSEVTLDVGPGSVAWGDELTVSTMVSAAPGTPGRPARGVITIADGDGTSCTVAAPGGSCTLTWDDPGPRRLVADYAGDELYGPATSIGRDVVVERRSSTVEATVTPPRPVTGEEARVDWVVPDHAGGEVRATIADQQCRGVGAGTCTGRFGAATAGQPQDVVVAYDGDARYLPSSAVRTVVPVGCHRLGLSGIDPSEGTLRAVTAGNCDGRAGYVGGTSVRVRVNPIANPAYDWVGVDWDGFGYTRDYDLDVVVGTGSGQITSLRATLRRQWNCHTVTWVDAETVPNAIRPIGGALEIDAAPNCPADGAGASASGTWQRGEGFRQGSFLAGSTITAVPEAFPGMAFYGYRQHPDWFGPIELVVDEDLAIGGVFGPECVELEVVADGPGTMSVDDPTNCSNPLTGFAGFQAGSVVEVTARPDAAAYVDRWIGDVDGQGVVRDAFDEERRVVVDEWSTTTTIAAGRTKQRAIAVIDACSRISAKPVWRDGGEGTAVRARDGDCPTDDDDELYQRGGTVSFEAVESSGAFARWNHSDGIEDAHRLITVSTDDDVALRPTFIYSSAGCVQVEARVAPGANAELSASGVDPFCVPGTLEDGPAQELSGQRYREFDNLTFTGTATEGDPLLGWVFTSDWGSGGRRGVPGATATIPLPAAGPLDVELHSCVAVMPEVTLEYPDGTIETGSAPAGFVQLADPEVGAPDCGFEAGGGAWRIGSATTLAPLEVDAFRFVRWEGDVAAAAQPDGLVDVTFDGSQPTITARAVYEVQCFELTIADPDETEVGPAPNCQPADARTPAGPNGSYIAGTDVYLRGTMPGNFRPRSAERSSGDHVWQGWVGDVDGERYRNPTSVVMDQDRTIGFSYRETTAWEDLEGGFDDLANGLGEFSRKTISVATMLVGEVLMGSAYMGMVSGAVGLMGGINAILEAMGADTGDFAKFVVHAEQTLEWLGSSYECIGVWGLDDGGVAGEDLTEVTDLDRGIDSVTGLASGLNSGSKATKFGVDRVARTSIRTNNVAGDLAASRRAYNASLRLKKATDALGVADQGLNVVAVGVDIIDIASQGGANWADNSWEAWSNPDVLVDCVEQKMPDYLGLGLKREAPKDDEEGEA